MADGSLLIQTVDFFTPIVDDPYTFGAIAAVNALSDVYAMGGRPLTAMNILCWPDKDLPADALHALLAGGAAKVAEAGAMLVGGHSVKDKELKYGLAVSGTVSEAGLWTNHGAREGDALVLTKPIGTGVISTALKRDRCPEDVQQAAEVSMLALNAGARDAAAGGTVHACTDVTGFGLLGHAFELARASGVSLVIDAPAVPLLPQALDLAAAGYVPGGAGANRAFVGDALDPGGVAPDLLKLLVDPQTSGGLLLSLPDADADRLVAAGVGARIGSVQAGPVGLRLRC